MHQSLRGLTLVLMTLLGSQPAMSDEAPLLPMGRQLLMERTTQGSSSKVSVIRVDFPPGFKTPLHTHEGEGPRYVLKGRLRVEDHGQIQVYGAGDTFWENGSPMTIENIGGSDAQMLVVELAKSP